MRALTSRRARHPARDRCWGPRRAAVLTLVAVAIGAGPLALQASPAGAATNGPLSILPANPPGTTTPRSNLDYTLSPGQSVQDSAALSNSSAEPHTVELYAADAYNIPRGGGFALRTSNDPKAGVGAWVRLSANQVTLAPHSTVALPLAVSVPPAATPGDHAGGIVALDVTPTPERQHGVNVLVHRGVAFRVYVRVAGPLHPGLRVENLRVDASVPPLGWATGSSHAAVSFGVVNTGNVDLDTVATATATDGFGRTVKRFAPLRLDTLLPGSSADVALPEWQHLPILGPSVTVDVSLQGPSVRESASQSFTVVPWVLVGAAAFVLMLVIAASVWAARRRLLARR